MRMLAVARTMANTAASAARTTSGSASSATTVPKLKATTVALIAERAKIVFQATTCTAPIATHVSIPIIRTIVTVRNTARAVCLPRKAFLALFAANVLKRMAVPSAAMVGTAISTACHVCSVTRSALPRTPMTLAPIAVLAHRVLLSITCIAPTAAPACMPNIRMIVVVPSFAMNVLLPKARHVTSVANI